MKIKKLEGKISELFSDSKFKIEKEFITKDNSRIDLAVLRNRNPYLAVEFEESYKWMRSRVLYDAVKADRGGFPNLAVVYPFEQRGLKNCWIFDFIRSDLDVRTKIIRPNNVSNLKRIFG
ncbi:hypothetical protein AKJ45_01260 [candidate division MSBL1 archaeon SCGC-AAA261F19]|uniref:Uncharacterized protein n=1 Tax=candidate division MSBL1 archaeon SCGC-AAA261F19 TaxID=1698275 RepID=A0A133VAW0_9EURY|nr:hypothetical protein AKJ45_01260 [candidate division MSBL1 archaeon SCGC-AAA261F19]